MKVDPAPLSWPSPFEHRFAAGEPGAELLGEPLAAVREHKLAQRFA